MPTFPLNTSSEHSVRLWNSNFKNGFKNPLEILYLQQKINELFYNIELSFVWNIEISFLRIFKKFVNMHGWHFIVESIQYRLNMFHRFQKIICQNNEIGKVDKVEG